jgi:hypothetical protein
LVELPLETCLERLGAAEEVEVVDAAADAGRAPFRSRRLDRTR